MAAFALALVLRAAATAAAVATGATTPEGGIASGLRVLTDPGQPARAFGAPGLSAIAYWSVVDAVPSASSRHSPGGVVDDWSPDSGTGLLDDPHQIQGTATARDIDAVASKKALVRRGATLRPSIQQPEGERRRLPDRAQLWTGDLGVGRGLDPRHRPTAFRQGAAPRHQRHPRRAWRRRHHLHPARQHRRHHRRPEGTRTGRRLRPTAPDRGTARRRRQRSPVVTDPRL